MANGDQLQVGLEVIARRSWSYVLTGTKRVLVSEIRLTNNGPDSTSGVLLTPRVSIDAPTPTPVAEPWTGTPLALPRPRTKEHEFPAIWPSIRLKCDPAVMGRLEERVEATLKVELLDEAGSIVATTSQPLTLLAPQDWWSIGPDSNEILAAYVRPNADVLRGILKRTREILQQRTGDGSTDGYQRAGIHMLEGPGRPDHVASACFAALEECGLSYTDPPGGWFQTAQRLRSHRDVLDDKAGTCIDTSLLYAACLAQLGLRPFLLLCERHCLAGYFRLDPGALSFATILGGSRTSVATFDQIEAAKLFEKRIICQVETTAFTANDPRNFLDATRSSNIGDLFGAESEKFESLVDVVAVWRSGITPVVSLAQHAIEEADTAVIDQWLEQDEDNLEPDDNPSDAEFDDAASAAAKSARAAQLAIPKRVRQWMRTLLDLDARNRLLKVRVNRSGVGPSLIEFELPSMPIGVLDDALFDGSESIGIVPPTVLPGALSLATPSDETIRSFVTTSKRLIFPSYSSLATQVKHELSPDSVQEFAAKNKITEVEAEEVIQRIIVDASQKNLDKSMKRLRDAARDVELETGTNELYLGLGILQWSEPASSGRQGGRATKQVFAAPMFLYPVEIRGGKGTPYSISLDSHGSFAPNYCLREKLRRAPHSIDLAQLEYPDEDDAGLDLDKLFASIEHQLKTAGLDNFVVRRRAVLGVFNYSNFRLWKDLRDHWKQMTEISDSFRHLVYSPNSPFSSPEVDEAERVKPHCPFNADDSQVEAIQWALDGKSFRLEGPPGTGKTQTIANLLASCLAHDRKVLFVAEKQIALEAVMNKLEARGLAGFCLNLHTDGDTDAKVRAKIREQVEEALDQTVDPQSDKWNDLIAQAWKIENDLDRYRDGVHSTSGSGLTLWSAQETANELGEGPTADVSASLFEKWAQLWPLLRDAASELEHALEVHGSLSNSLWRIVDRPIDEVGRAAILTAVRELVEASRDFVQLSRSEVVYASIGHPDELASTVNLLQLSTDDWATTNESVVGLAKSAAWRAEADRAIKQLDELIGSATQLRTCFASDAIERLDFATVSVAYAIAAKAKWPTKKRKVEAFRLLLGPALIGDTEMAITLFPSLVAVAETAKDWRDGTARELGLRVPTSVGPLHLDSVATLKSVCEQIVIASSQTQARSVRWALERLTAGLGTDSVSLLILRRIALAWREFLLVAKSSPSSWSAWATDKSLATLAETQIRELERDANEHRLLRLQRWNSVLTHLEVLRNAGLDATRHALLSGELQPEELLAAMRRGVVKSTILERLLAQDLDSFDGVMHDRKIQRFAESQAAVRDLLRQRIPGLVSERKQRMTLPSGRKVGELQDLLRELKPRRGRKVPIRTVLEKYGKSLTRIMPAFLMSPDSVATLLPVGAVDFDLVVFDEASQIRVAHAVGALGRAKAGIVVGDSKQMPPTSAFKSNESVTEEGDDDIETGESSDSIQPTDTAEDVLDPLASIEDEDLAEEIEIDRAEIAPDAESILTEFEEAGFPFLQLLCHFRSKDELLIAFSNAEIYEKPMLTFPSPHIVEEGKHVAALRLIQVDGQYERRKGIRIQNFRGSGESVEMTRTNLAEADAVVAEIRRRLEDRAETERWLADTRDGHAGSVLVVTFNKQQCELILKLLELADKETPGLLSHPTAGSYLEKRKITSKAGDATLIPRIRVQNLELVQGGEAETVIFSVAFTKEVGSNSNKVPLRFGPISGANGYRRLNVAATRAQRELIVFCSFDPDTDLVVKDTAEPTSGALLLKKFLLLAKHGQNAYGGVGVTLQRSRHLAEVADFIRTAGYEVRMSLGLSLMQVDIAVRDKSASQWQSAVLLDGPLWRDRGSAVQREVLPLDALHALGWKRVIRVWLVDWITQRDDAKRRLLEQLEGKTPKSLASDEGKPVSVQPTNQSPASQPSREVGVSAKQTLFKPFLPVIIGPKEMLDQLTQPSVREKMGALFMEIIKTEAPIETTRFTRLVAASFGFEKVREQRQQDILKLLNPKLIERTQLGDFIWQSPRHSADYGTYRRSSTEQRDLTEVAGIELVNALVDVLEMTGSVTLDESLREVALMFGVEKLTARVRDHLGRVVDLATSTSRVRRERDRLYPASTPR